MVLTLFGWRMAGTGAPLQPDDVTFSILLKGYGDCQPPRWVAISSLLHTMDQHYNMQPSTGQLAPALAVYVRLRDDLIACPGLGR